MASHSRQRFLIDPDWDVEWIHLGPGPEHHDAVRVAFRSGTFTALHTMSAGILRGTTAAGRLALLASLPASPSLRTLAQPMEGDACLLLRPAANLDLYLPESGGVMILTVPIKASTAPQISNAAEHIRCHALDPQQSAQLSRCMDSLEQIRIAVAGSPDALTAQRRLRSQLQSTVSALFRDDGLRLREQRAPLQRHLAVVRACAFIDLHLRAPIALSDLCAAAGVSTRALEYGFRDLYGLGPMAYVRNLRLCRVRHDLRDPTRNGDSVSSTARRWSFTHMGQFSHDYRALFGEMPSKTLAAHQRAATAAGADS